MASGGFRDCALRHSRYGSPSSAPTASSGFGVAPFPDGLHSDRLRPRLYDGSLSSVLEEILAESD